MICELCNWINRTVSKILNDDSAFQQCVYDFKKMNYPKMLQIYNTLVSENINDNLMHCARYRGVAFMPLRTLREFQWFCDAVLYQEYLKNDFRDLWCLNVTWWKYFYECYPRLASDVYLIEASKLFLKYCIVCYHDLELEP